MGIPVIVGMPMALWIFVLMVVLSASNSVVSRFGKAASLMALISALSLLPANAADTTDDDINNRVRGVIKASDEAILSADLSARILTIPFRVGDAFSEGDLLIDFDCDVQKAEAEAVRAAYLAAQSRHQSNEEMKKFDAIGQFDLKISRAEMREASARSDAMAARIKSCTIVAPYDGKVAELHAHAFEKPAPNQPLIKIVGQQELEINLIVPSKWLSWLESGKAFQFIVDETGGSHTVTIHKIGAEVDAVSRTVPVIGQFEARPETILPGMSGTAVFDIPIE